MSTSLPRRDPRASGVEVTADELIVTLADGRRIAVPLAWYPRLPHATPEERVQLGAPWRRRGHSLAGGGRGSQCRGAPCRRARHRRPEGNDGALTSRCSGGRLRATGERPTVRKALGFGSGSQGRAIPRGDCSRSQCCQRCRQSVAQRAGSPGAATTGQPPPTAAMTPGRAKRTPDLRPARGGSGRACPGGRDPAPGH